MYMLLDAAAAATGDVAPQPGGMGPTITMIIVYAVFIGAIWFFLFRPQRKQQKQHAAMLSTLETGDCVLTTSGFIGIVIDINDDTVIVEFGNNKNCRIPMEKGAISRVEKPGEA